MSNLNSQPILQGFAARHIALNAENVEQMLHTLGYNTLDNLIYHAIPKNIYCQHALNIPPALTEPQALNEIKALAKKNKICKTYIGQGYYYSHTPTVILRNVFENPAWYTAYTPYQPEISQGRLEALLNFQQMIIDLTGLPIANASMLDEATAAAEAMTLVQRVNTSNSSNVFFIDSHVLPQTIEVIRTRAQPLGIEVIVDTYTNALQHKPFAVLLQYPNVIGEVVNYTEYVETLHQHNCKVIVATDLLALCLLKPPGEWGADVVIGNSQRFGVPVGFGGPHAAFFATRDEYKRSMPGRLVGVSIDKHGDKAYRLSLQTREQHIRREKATSNICTAQALLAIMASMYACYHGPNGLRNISISVFSHTTLLREYLTALGGVQIKNATHYDTLIIELDNAEQIERLHAITCNQNINLRYVDSTCFGVSVDETTSLDDILEIVMMVSLVKSLDISLLHQAIEQVNALYASKNFMLTYLPENMLRNSLFLTHDVFNQYHSEHEMLRYLRYLADKDLALDRTMIPLGSCTMKLNASSEMIPVTWPEFSQIHPFAPNNQTQGYQELIAELEDMLCTATGYAGVSIQPNAGSQGEYAGLLIIQKYHASKNEAHRNICLIPSSAHGTNPASAHMVGMKVVVVNCDENGNIDISDLKTKAALHNTNLAAIMVTYPSTHGVFEEKITIIADIVHSYGGQVYIDGANMNALVGTALPGEFGGDVSHLNLHKTFCIPHGGGGPGVGPVAVAKHLVEFLPNHQPSNYIRHENGIGAVSAAPYGSASILPISWMYMRMMGAEGLTQATKYAILSANYIAQALADDYPILYTGNEGLIAHECILDIRPLQKITGISNEDIAKRLIDYGFHAPTMSFPVAGTLMVEPTESESKAELDRFIHAMRCIRKEINMIENGTWNKEDNPLKHAPHTAKSLLVADWKYAYTREEAAYPTVMRQKYWPPVGRVDNVYGDKNLCTCLPISAYVDDTPDTNNLISG
jgi:glycine dehydrogenase